MERERQVIYKNWYFVFDIKYLTTGFSNARTRCRVRYKITILKIFNDRPLLNAFIIILSFHLWLIFADSSLSLLISLLDKIDCSSRGEEVSLHSVFSSERLSELATYVPFYLRVFGMGVNEVMTLHIVAYKKSSGRCRSPKRDVNVTSFEKRDIFYRLARDLFISPRPASYLFYARR